VSEQPVTEAQRWHTVEHARDWIARMDREAGERDEELRTLVSFLSLDVDKAVHVLELGAGHGLLTHAVLQHFPQAHIVAIDLNPTMIAEGRQRLAAFGARVEYKQWDLTDAGWPAGADGPFDAAISSLALHHLDRNRKADLARQILQRLRPGGLYLNLDYVGLTSERLAQRYEAARLNLERDGQRHRGFHGNRNESFSAQMEDLQSAGFEDVDVFWKRGRLTLLGGTRPDR